MIHKMLASCSFFRRFPGKQSVTATLRDCYKSCRPLALGSDNDPDFITKTSQVIVGHRGKKLHFAYRPKSSRQEESRNRTLKETLIKILIRVKYKVDRSPFSLNIGPTVLHVIRDFLPMKSCLGEHPNCFPSSETSGWVNF